MPWYQPGPSNGYTKFLDQPDDPDRADAYVVSEDFLQGLLQSYRQAYVNAGGPDYEDSDSILLDWLAERGVKSNAAAANVGAADAANDMAAGQEFHTQSLAPGGAIPEQGPVNPPPIASATSGGDAQMYLSLSGLPDASGSAVPGRELQSVHTSTILGGLGGGGSLGGVFGTTSGGGRSNLLIYAAIAAAAYYLLKGKK